MGSQWHTGGLSLGEVIVIADLAHIPIIDVSDLVADTHGKASVAAQINKACRQSGFFYIVGHGVDTESQGRLNALSREFFSQPMEVKQRIAMSHGGRAWRGYFRVGEELTSGKPDQKEGLYFGQERSTEDPLVQSGTPLHGPNLFPEVPAGLRAAVLDYMAALTNLGHRLMAGIALGLGLEERYFANHGTREPLTLFRIFNYPPPKGDLWSVGEHTDYGLLTILLQDDAGGLEVKSGSNWVSAPPVPGSFVCNIGDMLDRMTRGVYRSTPHRVRNPLPRDRLSFPFFFDPNFFAPVRPIDLPSGEVAPDDRASRWDQTSVHVFRGTYGDYLLGKIGKVFPELKANVL
jgi:isopenicillin N synthase-like dioxygenase